MKYLEGYSTGILLRSLARRTLGQDIFTQIEAVTHDFVGRSYRKGKKKKKKPGELARQMLGKR